MLKIFQILIVSFLLSACSHNEGITQVEEKAFLSFTGNTEGVIVRLNESVSFDNISGDKVYKIQPGKYRVTISRGGKVVVDRVIMVGDSMTKEINIP